MSLFALFQSASLLKSPTTLEIPRWAERARIYLVFVNSQRGSERDGRNHPAALHAQACGTFQNVNDVPETISSPPHPVISAIPLNVRPSIRAEVNVITNSRASSVSRNVSAAEHPGAPPRKCGDCVARVRSLSLERTVPRAWQAPRSSASAYISLIARALPVCNHVHLCTCRGRTFKRNRLPSG